MKQCKDTEDMVGDIADHLIHVPKDKVELEAKIGTRPVTKDVTGETKGTYNITYNAYHGGKAPNKESNLNLTEEVVWYKEETETEFKYEGIAQLLKERNLISEIEGGVLIIKRKPVKYKPGEQLELFPDRRPIQPEFPEKRFLSKSRILR